MARKNPFAHVMEEGASDESRPVLDYAIKGASRSILNSIDELASRADKLLEGETIVELDPGIVDVSFIKDRLEDNEQEFEELLVAIRERGQDSPILVRPHPEADGRYMVVFGHRRLKAARALGRPVRAVIKAMKDQEHVVAQGQENSARANLSFIERAVFAGALSRLRYDSDNNIIMTALSLDRATLSKMLAVTSIPPEILQGIGAAKAIGRDRWYELKILLEKPSSLDKAMDFVSAPDFAAKTSDERFNSLMAHLKQAKRPSGKAQEKSWSIADKGMAVTAKQAGKVFSLTLKSKDAAAFGSYLSDRLEEFYKEFSGAEKIKRGD
ncbi:plasmid partitioning protein RepB [Rhizobium sp. HT1-10]|uniref:plasmid partitioning protein RepB n=1 Tax=Rhizobium sp. HT1-10 TaxID=3111638 RepID=UPI003C15E7FE